MFWTCESGFLMSFESSVMFRLLQHDAVLMAQVTYDRNPEGFFYRKRSFTGAFICVSGTLC